MNEEERKRLRAQAAKSQNDFLDEQALDDLDELEEDELEEEVEEVKAQTTEKKRSTWEEVEPELPSIWMPKELGDTLVGSITALDEGEYGLFAMIMTKTGEEIQTPAHKYLQSRLKNCVEGDLIKIVYKGEVKTFGKRTAMDYAVYKYKPLEV